MSILIRAKKARIDNGAWQLIRMNPSHIEILELLELISKPEEPPKKKRGRPAVNKNKAKASNQAGVGQTPKRRRGRPLGSKTKLPPPKGGGFERAEALSTTESRVAG